MMRSPSGVVAAAALAIAMAGGVVAGPLEAGSGAWAGVVAESSASWPAASSKVELRLEPTGKLVSVKLTGQEGAMFSGEFQASGREAVYEPPPPSGFMAFVLRTKQINPLEGQALVWARSTGAALVVYRLDINNGLFRLDRMVLTPSGNRLDLTFERREHDRSPARFAARLERQGK
jgi:hypothetical protein